MYSKHVLRIVFNFKDMDKNERKQRQTTSSDTPITKNSDAAFSLNLS